MEPLKPFATKKITVSYYEVPVEILENRERLADWAKKSLIISKNKQR